MLDKCWFNRQIRGAVQRPRFRFTSAGASSLTQEGVDGYNYILDLLEHMAVSKTLYIIRHWKGKQNYNTLYIICHWKGNKHLDLDIFKKKHVFIMYAHPSSEDTEGVNQYH